MAQTKQLWFRAKYYGYGWYPITWQGWLTVGIFILFMGLNVWRLQLSDNPDVDIYVWFLPQTVALVFLLLAVCVMKGEKAQWRWGRPTKTSHKS